MWKKDLPCKRGCVAIDGQQECSVTRAARLRTHIVGELLSQIRKLAPAIWRTFQGDEAGPVRSNFLTGDSKQSIGIEEEYDARFKVTWARRRSSSLPFEWRKTICALLRRRLDGSAVKRLTRFQRPRRQSATIERRSASSLVRQSAVRTCGARIPLLHELLEISRRAL
jgi:hypothetical protein